ncbi:MAG: hypothetical protein IPK10_03750 [Bacteroidetes bacterium]|nr:hypothetical protein [Bacteroidota bacterium]
MKKLLLSIMAVGLMTSGASAQAVSSSTKIAKANFKEEIKRAYVPTEKASSTTPKAVVNRPKSTKVNPNAQKAAVVGKSSISTTHNIYGSLVSEGGLLNYNPQLNVLSYTDRKPIGVVDATLMYNSGTVVTRTSTNGGTTWDTTLVVLHNTTSFTRYPQGAILNPPGNMVVLDAYAAATAPLINGTIWDGIAIGSIKLDGTNKVQYDIPASIATVQQDMPRLGMNADSNGHAYSLGSNYDFDATVPYFDGFVVNRAVWNSVNSSVDWDHTNIYHAFSHDPIDDSQNFSSLGNMAFSPDGLTGYVLTIGRDSLNDYLAPMPIIYRTTDGGATWSFYSALDYSPIFANVFTPNGAGTRPFYTAKNGFDVAVDGNGKIHILCEVAQAASNHPDSLNWAGFNGDLYDTYEDANGLWGAVKVGTVVAEPAEDPNSLGWAVTWDARAQICANSTGMKMAYTWMDTDVTIFTAFNENPNIKGASADFSSNLSSNEINFTEGTAWDANNYWIYVSNLGWDNGTDFIVPVKSAVPLNSGALDTDPWLHEYVSGIQYAPADYVNPLPPTFSLTGINEIQNATIAKLIYPNPATEKATVTLNL